jgi:hypothetical protein
MERQEGLLPTLLTPNHCTGMTDDGAVPIRWARFLPALRGPQTTSGYSFRPPS